VPQQSIYSLTYSALEAEMAGLSSVHTRTLWRALHREVDTGIFDRADFQRPLRQWVMEYCGNLGGLRVELPDLADEIHSTDGQTRKFLLKLKDGQTIETVLMAYRGRHTACVSTQAGCAMGCVFCATGQMGFVRHLSPGEIVSQVLHAQQALRAADGGDLRNLVLMGMGEPLHNYDSVMTALEIISDTRGISIGPSRITISTVGVVPGILRLAAEQRPYHLAVSLHGSNEGDRAALVPASRRWPLHELIGACRTYVETTGRRIFFEWTLIAGKNDSEAQAAELAELLRGIDAHINLIPLNPTDRYDGAAATMSAATAFQRVLREVGCMPSTVRQRRGIDVGAGCGQLRAEKRS